jgi:hypothetical protein
MGMRISRFGGHAAKPLARFILGRATALPAGMHLAVVDADTSQKPQGQASKD